jgi:hypothetical protein
MIKEGKLTTVAKTGGLKLDKEETWVNPSKEVKSMITNGEMNMETLKMWVNKRVILDLDANNYWFGIQVHTDDEEPELEENGVKRDVSKFVVNLSGKDYVTHQGLLNEAHKKGLISITTEMISPLNSELVVFKATATTKDNKVFSAYGDASKESVNRMIQPHIIRMAETRSINRALRLLTNIGMTSIDELGEISENREEQK